MGGFEKILRIAKALKSPIPNPDRRFVSGLFSKINQISNTEKMSIKKQIEQTAKNIEHTKGLTHILREGGKKMRELAAETDALAAKIKAENEANKQ